MKIEVGKQYKLTMPDDGKEYINISRRSALRNCYKDIVTIQDIKRSQGYGDRARIKENGYWVSFDHLTSLTRVIKYNKDLLCLK